MRRPAAIAALLLLVGFISATTVLDAIASRLTSAKLPPPHEATTAFQAVRVTGIRSYLEAINELRVTGTRVCLVHPFGADYQHTTRGAKHELARSFDVMLMIGNEDLSAKRGELRDQPDGSPSLLNLAEAAVNALALETLDLNSPDRPVCVPGAGAVVQLRWEDANETGQPVEVGARECWQQLIRINAGLFSKQIY